MIKAPEGCNAFNKEPHLHGKGNKNEVGYTNSGWLNLYALHCGYMENIDVGVVNVTMWLEGCFHVRSYDRRDRKRIWESYDDINQARKAFAKKVEELSK